MEIVKKEEIVVKEETEKIIIQKTIPMVSFYVGNFLFGIPAEKVVEINKEIEITPVPLSSEYILGIMNLRGQVIPVIDLAKKIKLNSQIKPKLNLIIKNEEKEEPVSLIIEEIEEILEVPVAKIEKPPEKIEGLAREYIKNVYQLPERLLLILDIERMLEV